MGKRKRVGYNNHHIIPRSRKEEGYNVEHEENQMLMLQKKHERIHHLHSNATPQEQLIECLERNRKVINPGVYSMLLGILSIERDEFYKKELIDY